MIIKGEIGRILDRTQSDSALLLIELIRMKDQYQRHAEWEKKRADRATEGSDVQHEILRAHSYNKGRAKAIGEVIELLFGEVLKDERADEHNPAAQDT